MYAASDILQLYRLQGIKEGNDCIVWYRSNQLITISEGGNNCYCKYNLFNLHNYI